MTKIYRCIECTDVTMRKPSLPCSKCGSVNGQRILIADTNHFSRMRILENMISNNCWHTHETNGDYICDYCNARIKMTLPHGDRWKSHKKECPVFSIEQSRNGDK